MMKKYFLLFAALAVMFTGCSDNDDESKTTLPENPYQYDENKVFKKSEIIGVWERVEVYDYSGNNTWLNYSCNNSKNYIILSENGVSDYYDLCRFSNKTKPKSWSFDGKNKFEMAFDYQEYPNSNTYQKVTCSFSIISVSDNELILEQTDIYYPGTFKFKKVTLDMDDYYQRHTYGYKVKDTTNLTPYWFQEEEDIAYIIGTRDDKLWVGVFDANNKDQLFEATDSEKFNWTKRVHIGYGEYEDYQIEEITVNNISNDYKRIQLVINNYYLQLWFTQSNKKYDIKWEHLSIIDWYNQSILVKIYNDAKSDYTCLSENGEVLFNGFSNHFIFDLSFPINYHDFVCFRQRFIYDTNPSTPIIEVAISSLKDDDYNYVKILKQLPYPKSSDYKMDVAVLNQNGNIWTFRIDVTEYSGEKHSHTVDIDINAEPIE